MKAKTDGHTIIAQRKTRDSHCFDPILVYLRNLCKECKIEDNKFKFYDSHAFQLEKDDHKYLVEWWGTDGCIQLKKDDAVEVANCALDKVISSWKR